MWSRVRSWLLVGSLALPGLIYGQSLAPGQSPEQLGSGSRGGVHINDPRYPNTVTMFGGAFGNDLGDKWYPFVSARFERRLTRFFSAEAALGYAHMSTTFVSFGSTIQSISVSTPMTTADLMLDVQLPLDRVAPYVGVSGGAYHLSNEPFGNRSGGLSYGLLGGLKLLLTSRVGVRGELHWRSDGYPDFRANDFEESFGLTYRF